MSDEQIFETPEGFIPAGRIEIAVFFSADGDLLHNVETSDADGQELPLMQSLGMLEMAKDSLLHPNEDEED